MAQLDHDPEMPNPMGLIRKIDAPAFEHDVRQQVIDAKEKRGAGNLKDLLYTSDTWEVE